jgi:hypothetical protein
MKPVLIKHSASIGCHAVSDVDCQSFWGYNRLIVFHFFLLKETGNVSAIYSVSTA